MNNVEVAEHQNFISSLEFAITLSSTYHFEDSCRIDGFPQKILKKTF